MADHAERGKGSRRECQGCNETQRRRWKDQEQEPDDTQRTDPCAGQVEGVDASDLSGMAAESKADGGRAKEERQDQKRIAGREPTELSRIPDDLERVERQTFGDGEAGDRGHAEQRCRRRESSRVPLH
ncbi:hypothetical protein [Mesorhizobium sp. L48C026A00]|uniref:hypothetical protein n=1 Tax=Mesorhizobium sp. L48C026A00 TaxID=1287182 RepID=UPI001FDA86B8|nr:hypothetical protein [Mesorhizobium sp. L48C026A00]